jgi:UDP-N-acetylglucosamine diphosphorylase/glucosamine-1-phosphate N-acetyltransferase
MQIILFDTPEIRRTLHPFSAIRTVSALRIGLHTIRERWERLSSSNVFCLTEEYLEEHLPDQSAFYIYIPSNIVPNQYLMELLKQMKPDTGIYQNGRQLAFSTDKLLPYGFDQTKLGFDQRIEYTDILTSFCYPHEIVQLNANQLLRDITESEILKELPQGVVHQGKHPFIINEGVKIEPCYINTDDGPVYIGKDVFIMGGSQLRGPLAILDGAVVKMGSQIYGGTTIGRHCVVGGEIKNSVIMDYSNKAHGGYLGDACIGSWCNLGAGTNCSNLKNTAGEVRVWNQGLHEWVNAGKKCGVLMGDYSRSAINTSFNTGTVVGIGSNVIGDGLTPKYIPDFTWNIETNERYQAGKFLETANGWMQLKQKVLTEKERRVLLRLLSKQ